MDPRGNQLEQRLVHIIYVCNFKMLYFFKYQCIYRLHRVIQILSMNNNWFQVPNKKQSHDHFLQHLVNSVNKLMGQHTADITNLEKKLHKQQDDIDKSKVQHAVDINILEHKLKKQQNIIDKLEEDMKAVNHSKRKTWKN